MKKNIEVEQRGPLKKEGFDKLNKFMKKNGKFLNEKKRLTLLYFKDKINENCTELKNDPVDLRIRVTNKKAEMIMKYGSWGSSDNRKELTFNIGLDQFKDAIEFLKHLGWYLCTVQTTNSKNYTYRGIEFAIVEVTHMKFKYYEAEIMVDNKNRVKDAEKKINEVCKELGLRAYDEKDFEKQLNKLNKAKEFQFNFKKESPLVMIKRFKEFF